ncbi:MAG: hypothetical protein AB7N24_08090 [Dehalococcoidia bacterium]
MGHRVELTDERANHIASSHPIESAVILGAIEETLASPEVVLRSVANNAEFLLAREVDLPTGTKHSVLIVARQESPVRFWIVTAFIARRLPGVGRWEPT